MLESMPEKTNWAYYREKVYEKYAMSEIERTA